MLEQVHISLLKEINHPHYNVTKPNEQHQFNPFEGSAYKHTLTGVDVSSRYKVARALKTKNASQVAFVLEVIYKKSVVFKYPEVFQCDNGPEFKSTVGCLKNMLLILEEQQNTSQITQLSWNPLTKS